MSVVDAPNHDSLIAVTLDDTTATSEGILINSIIIW